MNEYGRPGRRILPAVAALVVGLGVVGTLVGVFLASRDNGTDQRDTGGLAAVQSAASAQAALPRCADVFRPGAKIDYPGYSAGCLDTAGQIRAGGWRRCGDGRILIGFEHTPGITDGWGFVGDVWHPLAKPIADDPGYKNAYTSCG